MCVLGCYEIVVDYLPGLSGMGFSINGIHCSAGEIMRWKRIFQRRTGRGRAIGGAYSQEAGESTNDFINEKCNPLFSLLKSNNLSPERF